MVSARIHHRVFLATMDRFEARLRPQIVADKDEFIGACAAVYREHGTPNFFHLVDKHQQKLFGTLKFHYERVIPAFGALLRHYRLIEWKKNFQVFEYQPSS